MTGGRAGQASQHDDEAREAFAEAIKGLDEALYQSAEAAHATLGQLAAKGKDYSDNDLKEALVHLRKLQEDYVAIAARIADAASGHLRHELIELAMHAQRERRCGRARGRCDERVRHQHGKRLSGTRQLGGRSGSYLWHSHGNARQRRPRWCGGCAARAGVG
jgi:hypothetical protein